MHALLDPDKFHDRLLFSFKIQKSKHYQYTSKNPWTLNYLPLQKLFVKPPSIQDIITQTSPLEYTTLSTKIDDILCRTEQKNAEMTTK